MIEAVAQDRSGPLGESVLPESLVLDGISRAGPLPWRGRWSAWVRQARVGLNGLAPADAARLRVEALPLRRADGGDAGAVLDCALESDPPRLAVGVLGALGPGVYRGGLRVRLGAAQTRLPVELRVAAWWPWLLGAVLLGVLVLWVSSFLAGQAALEGRRAQVLGLRERLEALSDRGDGSALSNALADETGRALDAALAILAQPRPAALTDTRIPRVDASIAVGRDSLDALGVRLARSAPGAAAVARLTEEWDGARERIAAVRARFGAAGSVPVSPSVPRSPSASASASAPAPEPAPAPPPPSARTHPKDQGPAPAAPAVGVDPGATLDATLAALDLGLAESLVLPLADAMERELGLQVERVRLLAQSGAGERAGRLARRTGDRMEALLAALLERTDLVLGLRHLSQETSGRVGLLRESLAAPAIDADSARALGGAIDAAIADLARHPSLDGLQAFHGKVRGIELELLAARARDTLSATASARAQMERETHIAPIEAALSRLGEGGAREDRQRDLQGIVRLWRERVAGFRGPRQAAMVAALDDLERHIAVWSPDALAAAMRTLLAQWAAYGEDRFGELKLAAIRTFCDREAAAVAIALAANARALDLGAPDPALAGLDAALDGLGLRLARLPRDAACLPVLVDISGRLNAIGGTLFRTAILRSRLPPDLRLDAARRAGQAETVVLVERLMREPRPLALHPRTAPDSRVQDRELVFEVQGLDPAWGPGVRVRADFGDGTRWETDAASLAQTGVLAHRYVAPGSYLLRLCADLGPDPSGASGAAPGVSGSQGAYSAAVAHDEAPDAGLAAAPAMALVALPGAGRDLPGAPPLGAGQVRVQVDPSPVNRAQALGASLLSLRTGLALILALSIQAWRLAGRAPFGARGQDYLEAVVIGAGSQAGLEGIGALLN